MSRTQHIIRTLILLALACVTIAPPAIGAEAAAGGVLSASSEQHAWVILPSGEDRALVLHIPGDALAGTVRRVPNVMTRPIALGAHDDALLLAYEGERLPSGRVFSIRRLRTIAVAGTDHPGYSRPVALPPLIVGGDLVAISQFADTLWALVRIGERTIAYSLLPASQSWEPTGLPDEIERAAAVSFATGSNEPRLIARSHDGPAVIWTLQGQWQATVAVNAPREILYANDLALALREAEGGSISIHTTLAPEAPSLAAIDLGGASPENVAVATLAGRIVLLWEEPGTQPATPSLAGPLHIAVISMSAGVLYDAPARTAPPVSARQLEVLAFVVLSVAFAVGVFVLHPIRGKDAVVNLPPGSSLAPPSRRIFAAMFDAMPALYLASWIWGKPLDELLSFGLVLSSEDGIRPLLTAGLIMIAHSALGEAFWGRTFGKWMTGCRTVSRKGGRPSPRAAALRNIMKVLCPPIVLMSILNPGMPWPGSFGTYVIIQLPDGADGHRDSEASGRDPGGD